MVDFLAVCDFLMGVHPGVFSVVGDFQLEGKGCSLDNLVSLMISLKNPQGLPRYDQLMEPYHSANSSAGEMERE